MARLFQRYLGDAARRTTAVLALCFVVVVYTTHLAGGDKSPIKTTLSNLFPTGFVNDLVTKHIDRTLGVLAVLPVLISINNTKWFLCILGMYLVVCLFLPHFRLFDMIQMTIVFELLLYCVDMSDYLIWIIMTVTLLRTNYMFPGLFDVFLTSMSKESTAPVEFPKN